MSYSYEFRQELEKLKEWRLEELALMKQKLSGMNNTNKDSSDRLFQKMCVVMIYAHIEGFVKSALDAYLKMVTKLAVIHQDLKTHFVVLSIGDRFKKYENQDHFGKRVQFTEEFIQTLTKPFPLNKINVDVKSNLSSKVLKNLCLEYGLDHNHFEQYSDRLDTLISKRNFIAHGEVQISERSEIEGYITLAEQMMDTLQEELLDIIENQLYLKKIS